MKSLRSWLVGLAMGAALFCGVPSAKAQMPRGITYQGMLTQNGAPVNVIDSMNFIFSDKSGNTLFIQTDVAVIVTNGLFSVVLGPFPPSMTFDDQYSMTIVVTSNGSPTTLPAQLLWSAPYAFNAARLGGINVSATPVNGDIFPMPLDNNGKISSAMLPQTSNNSSVQTINGVLPDASGNFQISAGPGITITPTANGITITGSNGSLANPNLEVKTLTAADSSSASAAIVAIDSETNGNASLMVHGGIGANNSTGAADGSGLSSGSPQTYWADAVSVPAATTTALAIYNTLVSASSTIVVTSVGVAAFGGGITITSQGAGMFTITSKNPMGTGSGGSITALNYMVVNH